MFPLSTLVAYRGNNKKVSQLTPLCPVCQNIRSVHRALQWKCSLAVLVSFHPFSPPCKCCQVPVGHQEDIKSADVMLARVHDDEQRVTWWKLMPDWQFQPRALDFHQWHELLSCYKWQLNKTKPINVDLSHNIVPSVLMEVDSCVIVYIVTHWHRRSWLEQLGGDIKQSTSVCFKLL